MPGRRVLIRLNSLLERIDCDVPVLTELGAHDVWRKPLLHPSFVAAVLHVLGWPCRWRAIPDYEVLQVETYASDWQWDRIDIEAVLRAALDALPWEASNPEHLGELAGDRVLFLRGVSRAIDRRLPPAEARRVRGRRRFGRRRGVKRLREHGQPAKR